MSTFLTAWPRLTAIQVAVVISAAVATTVPSAFAIDFSVTSTADELDANPGDGTCATAAGACTLRAAIQEANALPEPEIDQIIISGGPYGLSLGNSTSMTMCTSLAASSTATVKPSSTSAPRRPG